MVQEATQDPCWCEVADEPVVVLNTQPVKASNGVEDKTEWIIDIEFGGAHSCQKRYELRRGEVLFKRMNSVDVELRAHKHLDGDGHRTIGQTEML